MTDYISGFPHAFLVSQWNVAVHLHHWLKVVAGQLALPSLAKLPKASFRSTF